jgi:hypothetical protein
VLSLELEGDIFEGVLLQLRGFFLGEILNCFVDSSSDESAVETVEEAIVSSSEFSVEGGGSCEHCFGF